MCIKGIGCVNEGVGCVDICVAFMLKGIGCVHDSIRCVQLCWGVCAR